MPSTPSVPELSPERIAEIALKTFGRAATAWLEDSAEAFARAIVKADRDEVRDAPHQRRIEELERRVDADQSRVSQYNIEHPEDGLNAPPLTSSGSGSRSGCIRVGNAIVCTSPWGRLKVGNKYVWVDFHPYCGPSFYHDSNMSKLYDPVDEHDPVWPVFGAWYDKHLAVEAAKAVRAKAKAARK